MGYIATPGIRWEFPKKRWLPGLWTFELGPRIGMLDAANEYAISIRVQVDFGRPINWSPDMFESLPFYRQSMDTSMWPGHRGAWRYP